jgi:hypothetical protein
MTPALVLPWWFLPLTGEEWKAISFRPPQLIESTRGFLSFFFPFFFSLSLSLSLP